MADISSLIKALKDKAVAQYNKGAPYRDALASALRGDMGGVNQALSKSELTPIDFATTFAPMGILSANQTPYFTKTLEEGFGNKISSPHGYISILSDNPHSPMTHSVTSFFIDEAKRGKGYGKELIDEALKQYPSDIGAQVSSPASAKAFYDKGFRLNSNRNANLEEILNNINDYSSAYLTK